jgi:MoaA/NifB/PqqE/SkfB family radical SAM enzyme
LLHKQLDLDFFKNQLGQLWINKLQRVTFCGNDGDPIYCRDLIEICKWIKKQKSTVSIVIVTNGSYKNAIWWQQLAEILNEHDEIHWSLDGIDQATNEKYRVNCNWDSIIQGVKVFRMHNTDTYTVWASIAFRFNENLIEQQKQKAQQLDFDLFQLTLSTKFGSHYPDAYGKNDLLQPTNPALISSSHRFERSTTNLSKRPRPGAVLRNLYLSRVQKIDKHNSYPALCAVGTKGVFLNSRGEFYPCCWTANRYEHNKNWMNLADTKFNLYKRTYNEITKDSFWDNEFQKFNSLECETKCTRARLLDLEHSLEW